MKQNESSIKKNVEIALANSGGVFEPADVGAIASLLRLSELLDVCFDTGDVDRLPQLLQRHLALMDALRLTPKSRNTATPLVKESKDYGKEITERYLRLIPSPVAEQTSQRAKPRSGGGGTGRKSGNTTNGVAKTRTRTRPSN